MKRFFAVMAAALAVSCSGTPSPAESGNPASASVSGVQPTVSSVSAAEAPVKAAPAAAAPTTAAPAKAAPAVKKAEKKPEPPPTTEATRDEQRILSTETVL